MTPVDPSALLREREALLAEIAAAFADVSRADGVSWSEAEVIDNYGSDEECFAARRRDTDRHWSELVAEVEDGEPPRWEPECGIGGFAFLDAEGFSYYLPAAMVLSIRENRDRGICSHLTVGVPGDGSRKWMLKKLSLLDERQARCVARFLVYMRDAARAEAAAAGYEDDDSGEWSRAYESHWVQWGEDPG